MMSRRAKPLLMVLDDDLAVRQTWTIIFRRHGFQVFPVDRGEAAIEAAREYAPDLLLADIRLPDMSGIEAARRIQEIAPACHVLLISGDSECSEALEEARAQSVDFEVLPKPMSPAELLRRIDERLHRRAS